MEMQGRSVLSQTYAWRTTASPAPRYPACQTTSGGESVLSRFRRARVSSSWPPAATRRSGMRCRPRSSRRRDVFGMTRGEAEQILRSEGYLFPGSSISKAFLRVLSPMLTPPSHLIPDESAVSRRDLGDDDGATLRLARAFLAYGVEPDYARRSTGKTALMLAPELACAGWDNAEDLIVLLIKCGADVHATCNHGRTPLVYAFRSLQMNKNRLDFPSYRSSGAFCVGVAFYLMCVSLAMTRRLLRANWSLYRDPEANFAAMQAGLLSQEEKFMTLHGHDLQGFEPGFCEITVEYLRVWEIDPLVLNFHYMTKVVTRIGLDREAVGEPEDGERAFAFADRSKQMTFLAQDCIRELCTAGSSKS